MFEAKTDKQITVNLENQITLSAEQQLGNFEYNWYDNNGALVGNGTNITLAAPAVSATYQLQVYSLDYCIYDYANVQVMVNPNFITSISPNPVNTQITVDYHVANNITTITTAQLQIVNQLGVLQSTQTINVNQTAVDISIGRLQVGTYTVRLVVNNNISDNKNFVKQ